MLFKGAMISDLSGALGGFIAARNSGGAYMRARNGVTNPNTPAQTTARTQFGTAAIGWNALTQLNRDDWNAWAPNVPWTNRIGAAITLSGFSAQVMVNGNLAYAGLAAVAVPPPLPGEIPLNLELGSSPALTAATDEIEVLLAAPIPVGSILTCRCTRPQSAGTTFPNGGFQRCVPAAAVVGSNTFTAPFNFAVGEVGFIEIKLIAVTGAWSQVQQYRLVAA